MLDLDFPMCQRCDDFDDHALNTGEQDLSMSDVLARLLTPLPPKINEDFS